MVLVPQEEAAPKRERKPSRKRAGKSEPEAPQPIVLPPGFKAALIFVCGITVICFALEQLLAWLLPEPATHFQEQAFTAVDWGFKTGLGVLIGLVAGKQA